MSGYGVTFETRERSFERATRNLMINCSCAVGVSMEALASRYGLSVATIKKICSQDRHRLARHHEAALSQYMKACEWT